MNVSTNLSAGRHHGSGNPVQTNVSVQVGDHNISFQNNQNGKININIDLVLIL